MKVGRFSYGQPHVSDWTHAHVLIIGSFVSIAPGVHFMLEDGCHNLHQVSTYPFTSHEFHKDWGFPSPLDDQFKSRGDIVVGNDVWLGQNAMILSGVTIGDGAVIAANSVVSRDVPPYAVMAGNPATIRKYRFSPAQINQLLKIRWWDWPEQKIIDNVKYLISDNIDEFLVRFSGEAEI